MQQEAQGSQEAWTTGMPRRMMTGMRWRTTTSIVIGFGWVVFILLFAGFWSGGFSIFQNIMIFFASIVTAIGILATIWAGWGMRWGGSWAH
jgi:hypothetical protein